MINRGATVELRALEYFVAVAEELHFGRAARRLHIVQPAVSQQVARLERELGVRLLDRSTRRVRLTDAGAAVLAAARETLAAAERVRRVAVDPHGDRPRTLRIGTGPGLTARLEQGVSALREANPDIEVTLADHRPDDRMAAVRRGELDAALVRGVVAADGLRVLPAWTEPLRVVLPACHPMAARPNLRLTDLAAMAFRHPARDTDPPLHDLVTAVFREARLRPRLGRPVGTVPDTLVEIGTSSESWTLLPAEQLSAAGSTQVRGVDLDPPRPVPGNVVVGPEFAPGCAQNLADAFAGPGGRVARSGTGVTSTGS